MYDTVINGVLRPRVLIITSEFLAAKGITENDINQDPYYVGLPVALNAPQTYNLSPDVQQASHNTHVSWVNKNFAKGNAGGIKVRLITAAEVHFILAEAAAKGWSAGDAREDHYNKGITASFSVWGLGAEALAYITQPEVAYDGTIKQILTQSG